jgi:predicted small secreted protein
MKKALLTALLLACSSSHAAAWTQVGTGKDGTKVLVDSSSIKVSGAVRQAWLKMTFPAHTQNGPGDDAGKWMDYSLNHAAFNCSEATSKSDEMTNYYEDGTNHKVPAEELSGDRWEKVPPNTALDTVMKFICGWN